MKKIIVLLFVPFLGFGQNCQYNEVVLHLTTGAWASEVSWSITDSLGNLIDSTSQTYLDSTTYYDTICLPNGCYNFNMFDTYGDGWQGGSYILVDSLSNVISSGNLQGSFSFGTNLFNLNSPFCSTACQFNEVVLQLNTGDWASEVSWSITDSLGILIDSTSQTYADSTTYYDTICLPNGCYNFNMYDTNGNGWQGGSFYILDSNNTFVCNGDLQGSFSFDIVQFCIPLIPQPCYDNLLTLELITGMWASEVSWSVTDTAGNILDSTNQLYQDNTTYLIDVCVPNGCYDFNMYDAYGDGWQGGAYQLVDSLSNVISSGNLQGSFSFGSNMFSINSSACPVLGCTVPIATNFNPSATADDSSCTFLNDNVTLLFNWADTSLPTNWLGGSYTDVYGVAINGGEYAVIGSTMGTHIIDVTNPTQSYEAAFVAGAQQYSVTHRDYFQMRNYLYAVCDQGSSTLQIIDLSNLPNSVTTVYDSDALIATSHNMFIDTLNKKLYSTNGDVLDISNPTLPTYLFNMGFSCHDLYVENDTGYFNCTSNGLQIYEMTTNSPQYLGSLTSYPQQGTNHSGWKKDNTYVLADENHGLSLKVIDVSDLNNLQVIALFNSGVDPNSIPHNLIIRDNFVYVSYYHDGLQIFDISDPYNPIKAGYYDTYLPDNHNAYAGNWGVDPLLPSGIILISDVQSGLFVLEFDYNEQSICDGDSLLFDSYYINTDGFYISNTFDSLGYSDIIVVDLYTNSNSSASTTSITACDSYIWNGTTYTTNGIYNTVLTNANGCDSVATLNLTITNNSASTSSITVCNTYAWNGNIYTTSGQYDSTFTNANGCDSVATLNLTITNSSASTVSITACDSYTWNGTTYSANGIYNTILTNVSGCDSVATLDLTITGNPVAVITQNGIDLEVTVGNTYTWNTTATTQTITPNANGWYWCIVTDANACVSDTAFFEVTNMTTAVNEFNTNKTLLKITDVLGRESKTTRNTPLFYRYDDGTVEKSIIIE